MEKIDERIEDLLKRYDALNLVVCMHIKEQKEILDELDSIVRTLEAKEA